MFVLQEVTGVPDGSPVFHEKGKLKLKLIHEHSKQALAVSTPLLCMCRKHYVNECSFVHLCSVYNYVYLL